MGEPAITVLMTVYKGEPYLSESIDSVLAQSFRDFELLIINDASPDGSRDVVQTFKDSRIRLVDNELNQGQTRSLNRGLSLARAGLVARLDQDDISHPERLSRQLVYLEKHPDVVLLGAAGRVIDGEGKVSGALPVYADPLALRWASLFENPFLHSAVVFRRHVVLDVLGGYDESYAVGQDYDLWARIAARYPVANLTDSLLDYRFHRESVSLRSRSLAETETSQIQRGLIRCIFGAVVPESWEALQRIYSTARWESVLSAAAVFDALEGMHSAFVEHYPDANGKMDVVTHKRVIYLRLADLLAQQRFSSIRAMLRAQKMNARVSLRRDWLRLLILWAGGAEARRLRNWWRGRSTRKMAPSPSSRVRTGGHP